MDSATEAYVQDDEAGPVFVELRNSVLAGLVVNTDQSKYAKDIAADTLAQVYASAEGTKGAVGLSKDSGTTDATTENVQDLLDNGSKNELYLREGDVAVFKVPVGYQVQVGMKALNSAVTYSVKEVQIQ